MVCPQKKDRLRENTASQTGLEPRPLPDTSLSVGVLTKQNRYSGASLCFVNKESGPGSLSSKPTPVFC